MNTLLQKIREFIMKMKQKIVEYNKENYPLHVLFGILLSMFFLSITSCLPLLASCFITFVVVNGLEFVNEYFIDSKADYMDIITTCAGCLITIFFTAFIS